jgi:hypothetical protein
MTWYVWRQDANGARVLLGEHQDRIAALAQVLILESGVDRDQTYWVAGEAELVCRTVRDLYRRLLQLGRDLIAAQRSLSAFLRALWWVSRPLRDRDVLDLDSVAALLTAAATAIPPRVDPTWRTADLAIGSDGRDGYLKWERIILSQIADLEDFAARPPGEFAYFGVDAPRAPGSGRRANPVRWYNFDPAAYLECAMAGSLGGWHEQDGVRVPVPGVVEPGEVGTELTFATLEGLTWADLADFAVCGQIYE